MNYTDDPAPQAHEVVAYMRTASGAQKDIRSGLKRQRERCEAIARKLGVKIAICYVDTGVSGLSPSRPALDALFDDLDWNRTRYVIAADRARLARNAALEASLERQIAYTGAQLVTGERAI